MTEIGIMDHNQGRKLGDSDFLDFHGQIWFGLLNLNYKFLLQSTESFTVSLNQFFFPCCHKREMYLYNLFLLPEDFFKNKFFFKKKEDFFNL